MEGSAWNSLRVLQAVTLGQGLGSPFRFLL